MRNILLILVLISFIVVILAIGKTESPLTNIEEVEMVGEKPNLNQVFPENNALAGEKPPFSCAHPTARQLATCRDLEQQILNSTLRIDIEAWLEVAGSSGEYGTQSFARAAGNGHATIKDGRYLVTHNHFGIPLPALESGAAFVFGAVTVYTAEGRELTLDLEEIPFTVSGIDQETLIFDFGTIDGQGIFAVKSLPSATFRSWEELTLRSGMEVAQVDWDGFKTSINWVTIEKIITDNGPARLVLSGGLTPGASGGGVFLNGQHIANNWELIKFIGEDGQMIDQVSTAALNSQLVTILGD
jgi:hypothetical protein